MRGVRLQPGPLYPAAREATADWSAPDGQLTVCLPRPNTAVLIGLTPEASAHGHEV